MVRHAARYLRQWIHFICHDFFWLWVAAAPVAVAIAVTFFFKWNELACDRTGAALQLLGVASVFWGVYQTRKGFGQDGSVSGFVQKLRRRPRWRQPTVHASVAAALGNATVSARAVVLNNFPENASCDDRLDLLLSWLNEAIKDIDRVRAEADQTRKNLKADIESERGVRESEDTRVMKTLEGISTGGLNLTVAATVWIFVGIILSAV